jgi:Activator of Hsp90 ATPase homolog 1-like protein
MATDYMTTITVDATPDEAFRAINDVPGWWGRITGSTAAVGDEFVYVVPGLHYSGFRVTELEPGRRVAWIVTGSYLEFISDKQEWNGSTVRFDIDEAVDGTHITFTHEGLEPQVECYEACSNAWTTYVRSSLKSFIETGEGTPNLFGSDDALTSEDHAELRERIEGQGAALR